jgi:protein SCO1
LFDSRLLLALLAIAAAAHAQTAGQAVTASEHVHAAAQSAAGATAVAGADSASGEESILGDIKVAFELADRDGKLVHAEDFRGRYVVLAFGYTHCPYVCPTLALNIGRALADSDKNAVGIFVSVDTERDTPAVNDDYATKFGAAMMGLGGSFEQINAAAANFKVRYAVTKSQSAYTVQHTANIYVINPSGELIDVLPPDASADKIGQALE